MRVKYFQDTDIAHLEFLDKEVYGTREINENVYWVLAKSVEDVKHVLHDRALPPGE